MFTIKEVIRLLTRIFVKQNKRFPKGLEGVDIRIKAKEIFDVGKKEGYTGGISETQIKHFLAFEKQAKPTETIVKEGKVIPFKYKKTFKQEIDEMGKKGEVIDKHPLQDIKDRIEPESIFDDWAKKDPSGARRVIRSFDITDEHLNFVNTGKINYKQMEKLLDQKLKGTETWEELKAIQKRKFPDPPEDLASGGVAGGGRASSGLNYLLGEDDQNVRVPYETGLKVYPKIEASRKEQGLGDASVTLQDLMYGGTGIFGGESGPYAGAEYLKFKNKYDLKKEDLTLLKDTVDDETFKLIVGFKKEDLDAKLKFDKDLENVMFDFSWKFGGPKEKKLAYGGIAGMLGEPTYSDGGRIGLKKGTKFDPTKRTFLKGIAALATLPVVGKYFKWAKPLAKTSKVLTQVPIENAAGMPAWFKPLVNKVIKEGDDVTKKFATQDREIVHQVSLEGKLGKDALGVEDIRVTQDLNTGNVRVQYNTPNSMGEYGVDLNYQAAEIVEDASRKAGKQIKTKPEFSAVEAEPRVTNWDGDIEWDGENVVSAVDDLLTDTTKLEAYATGKNPNIKKLLKSEKKQKKTQQLNESNEAQANYIEEKYGPGPDISDFVKESSETIIKKASGGRVPLAGGGISDEDWEAFVAWVEGGMEGPQPKPIPKPTLHSEGGRVPMFAGLLAKGGQKLGKFTKSEVLIQMLENTLKGSKDPWSNMNLPNFIKELKAKPELANDPQVWNYFTKGLPKNQRLVVHSDDTVDFWTQSKFGPHNIETTTKFHAKHPYLTRDQAVKIQNMEPEDQILEMKRLETMRDRSRTKQAFGGLAGMLGE